jgi:hypothetical protein
MLRQNGCSFFHSIGYEIAARALTGDPEKAYAVYANAILKGFARNQFWGAALQWDKVRIQALTACERAHPDKGTLTSEPLNNSLLALWGLLRGAMGIWPTLKYAPLHIITNPLLFQVMFLSLSLGFNVLRREIRYTTPAPSLEGATHTFSWLGKNVTVQIKDGRHLLL